MVRHKERTKKERGKDKNNTVYEEKTPFATKVLIVLMTMIILGLSAVIAFVGYKYYEKYYNIEVPNLVGLTYEQAEVKLAKKDLDISKKEVKFKNLTSLYHNHMELYNNLDYLILLKIILICYLLSLYHDTYTHKLYF